MARVTTLNFTACNFVEYINNGKSVKSCFSLLNFHMDNRAGTLLDKFRALLPFTSVKMLCLHLLIIFITTLVLARPVFSVVYFTALLVTEDYTASSLV